VQSVRDHGGLVIAQDVESAIASGMPDSAIATGAVNYVVSLDQIGPVLIDLVRSQPRAVVG